MMWTDTILNIVFTARRYA